MPILVGNRAINSIYYGDRRISSVRQNERNILSSAVAASAVTISAPLRMVVSSGVPGTWGDNIDTGVARAGRTVSVLVSHRYASTVSGVSVGGTPLTEQQNTAEARYNGIWAGALPNEMSSLQAIAITTATGERYETLAIGHLIDGAGSYSSAIAFNGDSIPLVGNADEGFVYLFLGGGTPTTTPPITFNATYFEHPDSTFTQFQYGDGVYSDATNSQLDTDGFTTKLALRFAL